MRTRDRAAQTALEEARRDAMAAVASIAAERDRLTAALSGAPEAVIVVDANGDVVLRNAAAERFHGARHADAVAEAAIVRLLDRARRGEQCEEELALMGPPRQFLMVRAAPLHATDATLGAAAFVHDVSEVRRVESVRRDFVANVSHELKTPIGALALLAETIADGGDPSTVRHLSERLVREADRLAHIVDDLLDLSLIEGDEIHQRERTTTRSVVHEAVERIQATADARGIPVQVNDAGRDVELVCDRAQIVSALANLVDNAVKYSDVGQSVEIEAKSDAHTVAFEVRDHGIGIPARDLERVFERFYRVDRARSRATGGTGLGLAIVRNIAHAHGGRVSVASSEGEGSVFRLELPRSGGEREGCA